MDIQRSSRSSADGCQVMSRRSACRGGTSRAMPITRGVDGTTYACKTLALI